VAEVPGKRNWLTWMTMTDFKAMLCILGGVIAMMCAVFYGFLFLIYPNGATTY
jgi:hypothetical protein